MGTKRDKTHLQRWKNLMHNMSDPCHNRWKAPPTVESTRNIENPNPGIEPMICNLIRCVRACEEDCVEAHRLRTSCVRCFAIPRCPTLASTNTRLSVGEFYNCMDVQHLAKFTC